jgi:hypothetical protein
MLGKKWAALVVLAANFKIPVSSPGESSSLNASSRSAKTR